MKLLKPIREKAADSEPLASAILDLLFTEIYQPLLRDLRGKPGTLKNSREGLLDAIRSGRLTFERGRFTGRFSASLSSELRKLGAEWDRGTRGFAIRLAELPPAIRAEVEASEARFQKMAEKIDERLRQISPAEIAGKLKAEKIFDTTIYRVEKDFKASVKGITVAPTVTDAQRERIAKEYTDNLQLYIRDFADEETKNLRKTMSQNVARGLRYEQAIKELQRSYGVSYNKAKFLARQETNLLMTKYAQVRYEDAGVTEYTWRNVNGSAKHPVRPMHKALDGRIFSWKNPPIVNAKGERKNPGQDFNCRCYAIPIVRFKGK